VAIAQPYTLVVTVSQASEHKPMLDGAWRLYKATSPNGPTRSFCELLERYGSIADNPQGSPTRFIPRMTTRGGGASFAVDGGREFYVSAFVKVNKDRSTSWAWYFGLYTGRYLDDVARRRAS
jgi:hypothetical protein